MCFQSDKNSLIVRRACFYWCIFKKSSFTYPRRNTALHAPVKVLGNIGGIIYSRESFPAQYPVGSCKSRKNEVWLYILKSPCECNFTCYMKALSSYSLVLLLPQIFSFPNYSSPCRGDSLNSICCAQVWFATMFENRCTPQAWHGSTSVCHRALLAYLWLEDGYQAWLLVKTEQGRGWDGPAINQTSE